MDSDTNPSNCSSILHTVSLLIVETKQLLKTSPLDHPSDCWRPTARHSRSITKTKNEQTWSTYLNKGLYPNAELHLTALFLLSQNHSSNEHQEIFSAKRFQRSEWNHNLNATWAAKWLPTRTRSFWVGIGRLVFQVTNRIHSVNIATAKSMLLQGHFVRERDEKIRVST